jgi:hypothetical protein
LVRSAESLRIRQCRLTPELALGTLDEAVAFLEDRGMLTRMPDCSLPSLFGACHEEPGNPAGRGFDLWPKTKWIWSFQLTASSGALLTKMHRGKSLYLSADAARAFDPLVRKAIAQADGDDALLLDHLATHGPSLNDDVQLELGWDGKRLKSVRNRLERVGAIVCDGLVFESIESWYFAPMRRWDDIIAAPAESDDPLGDIVVAGLKAAVVAPEADVASWFSWPVRPETIDSLVRAGRIVRPAPGLIATTEQSALGT